MSAPRGGDVAIVGAGLIGLAIAFELAERGATVRLYDRAEPARAASWAGAGLLAPFSEDSGDPAMLALCATSLAEYPGFVQRVRDASGIDPKLHLDGTVHVAYDREQFDGLLSSEMQLRDRGIASQRLDRRALLAREAWLGAHATGALVYAGEGHVDNRRLGRALQAACEARGVSVARVTSLEIECDGRRALGVRSDLGFAPAAAVVNACGAWAAQVEGIPERARPPVEPVKGQMLALEVPIGLVRHATWVPGAYLVPRDDGRLLIGATVERAGYDARVTAAGLRDLLAAALLAAPALGGFTVSETWAGIRPGSPDGRPMLGETGVSGLFVATGHYRNGILLAPATARLLAAAIEGTAPAELEPFSPQRFETEAAATGRKGPE